MKKKQQVIYSNFEKLGEYILTRHHHPEQGIRKAIQPLIPNNTNTNNTCSTGGHITTTTLRHVLPYLHCYNQKVENYEGRMTNKTLHESYCREYGVDESTLKRMCEMNVLTLNEKPISLHKLMKYKLKDEDTFQVKDMRMDRPIKHFDKLEIIEEGNDYVVVMKPAGVCVHPIRRYHKNSLFYMMEHEYSHHFNDLHCKTIHRIDKETCGILIIGKNSEGARHFQKLLKEKQVEKQYIAKVNGIVKGRSIFEINDPLVCIQRWDNIFKSVPNKEVEKEYRELCKKNRVSFQLKPSKTLFKVLHKDYKENTTILSCSPVTGRNHQIREHLIGRGYTIVGDVSSSSKVQSDYVEQRSEKGSEIWNYKLDLFERFGFSPEAEKQALQDTILEYRGEFPIQDHDLNLFSYRYKVGGYDFRSELTVPDWIDPDLWQTLKK